MAAEKLRHFFEFTSGEKNRMTALCKLCDRIYKDLNGIYSNFIKHLKRKHLSEYRKAFQTRSDDNENDISDYESSSDEKSPMDTNNQTQLSTKQNQINLSLTKNLIIKCNLPLTIVENLAFRNFVKDCNAKWKPISTKTIKSNILVSMKSKIHTTINNILEQIADLTLTIDAWSDRRGRGFLGVTCHFIDRQMIPQAFLIDFVRMKSPHSSDNIQQLTECILDRFKIKQKVYRIITDNASNMVKAYKFGLSVDDDQPVPDNYHTSLSVDDGQEFDMNDLHLVVPEQDNILSHPHISPVKRMSCFAHTLQLTIRDGLQKHSYASKILMKCQTFSRLAHKSSKIADRLDHIHKHIERPNTTRWSSEFMLIKSILSINRDAIESISNMMEDNVQFSSSDFTIMTELIDILEPFHLISSKCQADKVVTISLVVPSIVHLLCHLKFIGDRLVFCTELAKQLMSSIEKRFAGIIHRLYQMDGNDDEPFSDALYFMAAVLDPLFKFFWIRDLNLPMNVENRLKQHVIQLILDEISRQEPVAPLQSETMQIKSLTTFPNKRLKLFTYEECYSERKQLQHENRLDPSVELDAYLNDPVRSNFSDYWYRSQLTSLKRLVSRIFSVQASSAPIERVFSQAGLILSSRRTRMNEQLFKDIVFLKANQSSL